MTGSDSVGMTTLQIRELSYTHPTVVALTEELQAYYVQVYGGPDSMPMLPDEFAPPEGRFFVGFHAGVPVAMGGWRQLYGEHAIDAERPAEIKRMYVVKAARGRGFARQLLARLEESARQAGADAMVLQTGSAQPDAIALYVSAGYRPVARFGFYACAPDAVHLARGL